MLWFKAFHIFFVISWFAGIFYLPRIFVNLAAVEEESVYQHLLGMAQRLYRFILPLAVLAVLCGIAMIALMPKVYMSQGWMHAKLALVLALIGYHHACGIYLKRFEQKQNTRGHVFYRWFNEVPVLLLLPVCILVIVRPF